MRDTWHLRRRLVMLACLPVLGAACSDPPRPASAAQPARENARAAAKAVKKDAKQEGEKAKRSGPRINSAVESATHGKGPDPRLQPTPGDPPHIDGYNPEEEPCPSGNWCGTITSAMAIAPNPEAVPKEMECPVRVSGAVQNAKIEGPEYEGLSSKPSVQGSLNQHGTELARADGKAEACCYHWFEYCSGRPLIEGGAVVSAAAVDGSGWAAPSSGPSLEPVPEVRDALVAAWLDDAAAEHASVASFARVVLELLAVGAPAEIVAAAIEAGGDEVAHAQACYAIASRLGGRAKRPGPLPAVAPREASLVRVAADTFVEGCVGETIAALRATRAARRAADPQIRRTLERIADDEGRHAAVAWRTLHWALREGGREVADAVARAAAHALAGEPRAPATPDHRDWSRFGRLTASEHEQSVRDARRDIIAPMLADLMV